MLPWQRTVELLFFFLSILIWFACLKHETCLLSSPGSWRCSHVHRVPDVYLTVPKKQRTRRNFLRRFESLCKHSDDGNVAHFKETDISTSTRRGSTVTTISNARRAVNENKCGDQVKLMRPWKPVYHYLGYFCESKAVWAIAQ